MDTYGSPWDVQFHLLVWGERLRQKGVRRGACRSAGSKSMRKDLYRKALVCN